MSFINVKCPSCGGDIQLDSTREFGFCLYCGAKVVNSDIHPDIEELYKKAESAYKEHNYSNYSKAFEHFTTVTQYDPDNWKAAILRELSKCYISPYTENSLFDAIENIKKMYQYQIDKRRKLIDFDDFRFQMVTFIDEELSFSSYRSGLLYKYFYKWDQYFETRSEFEDIEAFMFFKRDLNNCINGLEFCTSLLQQYKGKDRELSSAYYDLFRCFGLLSKHHKINNGDGKWIGINCQERKIIITKYDQYNAIKKQIDEDWFRRYSEMMHAPIQYLTKNDYEQPLPKKYDIERMDVEERNLQEEERLKQWQERERYELEEKKRKVATLPQYLENLRVVEADLEDAKKHKGFFGGKRVKEAELKVQELKDHIAQLERIKRINRL